MAASSLSASSESPSPASGAPQSSVPCGDATPAASRSHSSVSSAGSSSGRSPLHSISSAPGQPGRAMSWRSRALARRRSSAGSGRSPTRSSRPRVAASASASAASHSARNSSSFSSSSTSIGTRPSGSAEVIHRSCSSMYAWQAAGSAAASRSGSISPAASRSSRWLTSLVCISAASWLRSDISSQTCSPMIPFGSVPVASSHVRTSPTVATPSLIFWRMASADVQNTADSGLPAASSPRRMPGSEPSASSGGAVSSASATSRLVNVLSGRPARSATRSASRLTKASGGCRGLQAGAESVAPRSGAARTEQGVYGARLPRFYGHSVIL